MWGLLGRGGGGRGGGGTVVNRGSAAMSVVVCLGDLVQDFPHEPRQNYRHVCREINQNIF